MKTNIFIIVAAVMILAASCGQGMKAMSDEQFAKLMMDIYYKLPESVLCDELKTEEQRKSATLNTWENPEEINDVNHLSFYHFYGEGTFVEWNMAGYVTDDRQDVVLIVRLYGSVREEYETKFDKTLNYNIKTGKITEIERPMDPFTVDELIDETHFDTPELALKAKAFYRVHKHPVLYFGFDRNGFFARADLLGYAPYDDPWNEQNRVQVTRQWNGSRFVKGDNNSNASNSDVKSDNNTGEKVSQIRMQKLSVNKIPGEIAYQGDVVEAYTYTDKTGENIVILAESDVMETAENEYGDVEYYKNLYAYSYLKKGNDWEENWRLYDNSEECFNHPAAEFVKGSFSLTDLNNDGIAETWIMYIKSCKGDVSPDPMFLIMNDNVQFTYTISGLTKVLMSDGVDDFIMVGGEYELDERFLHRNTPLAFVNFAKDMWEKHLGGN